MRTWKIMLAIVSVVVGLVLGVSIVWRPSPMPDLSSYEVVGTPLGMCPRGSLIRVGYNRPGSDPDILEAVAFYRMSESLGAKRPFIVALFKTDAVGGLLKVYVDRDLDGRVDVAGMPGERGLGRSPCDELPLTQASR